MQNSLRRYELLKISVFCQKREDNNILTKYSHCLTESLFEKERATGNLRKLVCVVNNIQGIAVCCFTSNLWKTAGVNLLFATLVLLQIRNFCQKSRTFSKQRTLLLIYLNGLVRSQTFRHLEVCHFCAKQCAQQRNARNWSLKKVRFAVLGESSAKERAQLYCCLKLAPNHTWQLSFCFKLARIVKKVKLVQETVRNGPVA